MNVYLSLLAEVAAAIVSHQQAGQVPPSELTTVLQKGISLVTAFTAAQANLVKVSSLDSAIQDFEVAVGALKSVGISLPTIGDQVLSAVTKYEASKANLESGQAAFVGSTPYSDAAKGIVGKTVNVYAVFAGSVGEAALIGSNG